MNVIPPLTIDAGNLTSTTVAEPHSTETAYSASAVYVLGDRRISTTTHRVHESLAGTAATVTMTIASPCVVTWVNHEMAAGTQVAFSTTGALPTGLTAGTVYYVLNPTTDTFQLAATSGGAAINTSGSQSGVHTAIGTPNKGRSLDDPAWWLDVGPTQKWAMFDLLRNTATTDASPLTVVITPGQRFDALGLVGLDADSVTITVQAGSPLATVYSYTLDLTTRVVTGWYDYFFAQFDIQQSLALFDLPPYVSSVITITLTRTAGNVSCGGVVLGQAVYLGSVKYDATDDVLNFSDVTRDIYGTATLVPRRNVPINDLTVWAAKSNVNRIRNARDALNAVPALWSGLDDASDGYFEAVLKLGVYKKFSINLAHPEDVVVTLSLEEV